MLLHLQSLETLVDVAIVLVPKLRHGDLADDTWNTQNLSFMVVFKIYEDVCEGRLELTRSMFDCVFRSPPGCVIALGTASEGNGRYLLDPSWLKAVFSLQADGFDCFAPVRKREKE